MTPIPIDLPIRPSEAAALTEVILAHLGQRPLNDDTRNRIAGQAGTLGLTSCRPLFGSLEADPVHNSVYYLAVDGVQGDAEAIPLLLRLAPSSSPASALFPGALLIGRMRPTGEREIVVNAVPFGPDDTAVLDVYSEQVARVFLPRPQGASGSLTAGSAEGLFPAYRSVFKSTGLNFAAFAVESKTAERIREGYCRIVRGAVRAGWREGYTAELAGIEAGGDSPDQYAVSLERAKEAARTAANFTKFSVKVPRPAMDEADDEARFAALFPAEERKWILEEFSQPFTAGDWIHTLSHAEVVRLAAWFGASLRWCEQFHEFLRSVKSICPGNRGFDFEVSLEETGAPTTPQALVFVLHWLKARGCPAQFAAPAIEWDQPSGELSSNLRLFTAITRQFNAMLSIDGGSVQGAKLVELIGRATGGRWSYRTRAESVNELVELAHQLR